MPINQKLLDAIKLGNEEGIKLYVRDRACSDDYDYYDTDCINVNIQNDEYNNWSLLHYAIFYNKPNVVRLLLNLGVDLEIKAKKGMRPLHLAVFYNRIEIAKILLDEGADVNVVGNLGNTPLDNARRKYSSNEDYKNITELLEEVVHNRTTISSTIEAIIASNISNGITDMKNSTTPSLITATTVVPQHLHQDPKNTTSLLFLGDNAENSAFSQASSFPSINGNALLMFIGYICTYAYRKMFSTDGPSTVMSAPSLGQDHTLKLS
ncbi:MAG: hypothetical protein sL5_01010 [Candidatus Mesenet longicola]|uniref:Ankyrin repeat domain-containing protein n=1 Tax=Candidatus Mesenet longicola TaxID=1892558 RepID=A0A8J3HRS0_9RICK|nr:MAG: hypothetical protein sGL2_01350 [Candidatus Mesenet longicola]GHM59108.1 MAG: hypothetical protein sL5_01010 [Candidatus Mesenet longicola]